MFTASFWSAALERMLMTFAQALLAVMVVDGFDIYSVDWGGILATAGIAAAISLLKSIITAASTGKVSVTGAETPSGVVAATLRNGEFIAGPAALVPDNDPVAVIATKIPYRSAFSSDTKSDAAFYPGDGPGGGG